MSHDTSGIIDVHVERKQPVNINTIKKGYMMKDKWDYVILESISKRKYLIDVVSEESPKGYKLYLHHSTTCVNYLKTRTQWLS